MRSSSMRRVAAAVAAVMAVAAAPALRSSALADGPSGDDPNVRSTNMSWVANLAYDDELRGAVRSVDKQGGTDLEVGSQLVLDEAGNVVERDFAYTGTYQNGFYVIDVTDPEHPVEAGHMPCNVLQGDIQVMTRPDLPQANGLPSVFVTYAIDGSAGAGTQSACFESLKRNNQKAFLGASGGSLILDVSDPSDIQTVGFIKAPGSTHNGTIQGFANEDGTTDWLFYNSENDAGGNLSIWDLNDPADATLVARLATQDSGTDTHDVTFSADGSRAYVASITNSYILDTTDPRNPTMVARIVDPANGIHHQADPITVETELGVRDYLVISDEIAGAAGNGYCPGGGLHIWDITEETVPVKVGAYFMPDIAVNEGANTGEGGVVVTCTSHVLRMYPEQGVMTIANMAGGVRVLDLTDLVGVSVGHMNTSTGELAGLDDLGWMRFTDTGVLGSDAWAVKAHPERFEEDGSFYMFSNDQTRGFEVFRFDGSAEAAVPAAGQQAERGRMVSVSEALARWQALDLDADQLLYSCRFPTGLRGALGL